MGDVVFICGDNKDIPSMKLGCLSSTKPVGNVLIKRERIHLLLLQ